MKYYSHLWVLLVAAVAFSCSQFNHQNLKRRNSYDYYVTSDTNQYYLQPLPEWANFSSAGDCRRKSNIRYLDLVRLRSSMNFTYEEAVQFQYALSKRTSEIRKNLLKQGLTFESEEKIFYDVTEKIRGGRKPFKVPDYKKVHLIWIDDAITSKEALTGLKTLLKGPVMDEAPAVLLSLCLDHAELEEFIKANDLEKNVFGFLPFEVLSIFGEDGRLRSHYFLDLPSFFRDGQDLHLFLPKAQQERAPLEYGIHNSAKIHSY